jgi:lipoprotein-anchoring transpeptidase ErfK/SrfK
MPLPKSALFLALLTGLFASCATTPPTRNPEQTKKISGVFVNPHPAGSYDHFKAQPGYQKTYKVYKDQTALSSGAPSRITIDLGLQRAVLYKGDEVAMDYPVSSGKRAFPTPPGKYQVLEKLKSDKRSNLYGKIYDAEGNLHKSNADSTKDKIPEGGKFVGASMPYWMRLSWGGIGMHRGRVPRYAASHGCVRTYSAAVSTVYSQVHIGTPVSIVK